MKIATVRFGNLEVDEGDILFFHEGLLGFEKLTRFSIVDPGDDTLIMWLQSLDDGALAFPIIEPQVFWSNYSVKLISSELESLGLESITKAKIYSILTIPKDVTKMSANLKAPIVINSSRNIARQIVLQDNKLSVQYEMYRELKAHIITMANASSKTVPKQTDLPTSSEERDPKGAKGPQLEM